MFGAFKGNKPKPVIFIVAFALIGVIALSFSFADTPKNLSPEQLHSTRKLSAYKVAATKSVNAMIQQLTISSKQGFSVDLPRTWTAYQYAPASAETTGTIVQLRSPDAEISSDNFDNELVIAKGSLIEISSDTNTNFSSIADYMEQLSGNTVLDREVQLANNPARQYKLTPELEKETGSKLITSTIQNGIQYTVSLSVAAGTPDASALQIYQAVLKSFNIGA